MRVGVLNCLLQVFPPILNMLLISGLTIITMRLRFVDDLPVWMCYLIALQIFSNWIQFLRNKSFVTMSKDNFPGSIHRFPNMRLSYNDPLPVTKSIEEMEDYNTGWKECISCDMHVPSRSHHCPHCRRCIYVLDHHCFFLGHCVGRSNMRFYLIFCLYSALGCGFSLWHIFHVMTFYRNIASSEAMFFFFPFSVVMYMMNRAAQFEVIYVFFINFGLGALLMSAFLFLMGMFSVFNGSTSYEERKHIETEEKRMTSRERFREVFGSFGVFHFLVPVLPFEEPNVRQGYSMVIDTYRFQNHSAVVTM